MKWPSENAKKSVPAARLDPDGLSNLVSLSVFHAMPVSRVTTGCEAPLSGLYTMSNVSETTGTSHKLNTPVYPKGYSTVLFRTMCTFTLWTIYRKDVSTY